MREYLSEFFREFDYSDEDSQELLRSYDKIAEDKHAYILFSQAITAYENNIKLDYAQEIFARVRQAAEIVGIHTYTVELLAFICMSKHLKALYIEQKIDLKVYRDSMLDLKWKLWECKAVKGICGSFVAEWFPGFFDLSRFALGRLQFEIVTVGFDYDKNGVVLKKGESKAINVHIPRTMTPIDKDSCDAAYEKAREFFSDKLDRAVFVCYSWLLFPENKSILPPHTNTYRFMSEYDIVEWGYNSGEDLWRLFDTEEKDPEKLPADSTLRRCYAEHLMRGGRVGFGLGVKI
ncbi:MAG: hypothetical protein E7667_06820 [Ruminococcaceae bacterium]|nr:hypothetical protein [Oscillospiraceae bacterium]